MEELRLVLDQVRQGAPNTLIGAGIPRYEAFVSETDAVRCAWAAIKAGADLIYSSGMEHSKFKALARERIPFVGHVGYIPAHNTWFGGPRAVGKSYAEAMQVYEDTLDFQETGRCGGGDGMCPGARGRRDYAARRPPRFFDGERGGL